MTFHLIREFLLWFVIALIKKIYLKMFTNSFHGENNVYSGKYDIKQYIILMWDGVMSYES